LRAERISLTAGTLHKPRDPLHEEMAIPRIGILGGTFNPVHNGHLAMARAARDKFSLDRVLFIPDYLPPHKPGDGLVSGRRRLAMLRRALRDHPEYRVSEIELRRKGRSYTVETLRELKGETSSGSEFFLIMGADNLLEISTWKEVSVLVKLARFIVVTRPGFKLNRLRGLNRDWARRLRKAGRLDYIYLSLPVSSREIRDKIQRGGKWTPLVPPEVAAYIKEKHLYRSAAEFQ